MGRPDAGQPCHICGLDMEFSASASEFLGVIRDSSVIFFSFLTAAFILSPAIIFDLSFIKKISPKYPHF